MLRPSKAVWPVTGGDTGGLVDNDWLTVRAMLLLHVHVRHVAASVHAQSTWCKVSGGHRVSMAW